MKITDLLKKDSIDLNVEASNKEEILNLAKENNVFIVNEDRIFEKGADMIAIPQEIHNKYQNDLTYQVVINTIINR